MRGVRLAAEAVRDIQDIRDYIDRNSGRDRAHAVITQIESAVDGLAQFPERGNYLPELAMLDLHRFRETRSGPYRIICQIKETDVEVVLVADGRREMRSLLRRRLLEA